MKYVYILESLDSLHYYVGITDDLPRGWQSTMLEKSHTRRSSGRGVSRGTSHSATRRRLLHLRDI
jgi:predicted GIY-YIG superfamily endonuclease